MPIPDFESVILPVLEFHADNLEHLTSETIDRSNIFKDILINLI